MKDENVICVERKVLETAFDMGRQYWQASRSEIDALPFCYLNRRVAENDFSHKQIIPYAIVQNKCSEILCYQRHGSEQRLSDLYSVGIGGHVNDNDCGKSLLECLLKGLQREFGEEIGVNLPFDRFSVAGMINEEQSEVGNCHTGIVFVVKINDESLQYDTEIGNPQWRHLAYINMEKFELWSSLALKLLKLNNYLL